MPEDLIRYGCRRKNCIQIMKMILLLLFRPSFKYSPQNFVIKISLPSSQVHKLIYTLSRVIPVGTLTPFLNIHFNIILQHMLKSLSGNFS
jgi:hypothetical protein